MSKSAALLLLLMLVMLGPVAAQPVTTTTSYSVTVTTTITPTITAVNLSPTAVSGGAANAGAVVGAVSVTTNPPGGSYAGVVTLGGADAAKFALSNGGRLPCNLVVGAANVPAGNYAITLAVTQ